MIDKNRTYLVYVAIDADITIVANDDTNVIVRRLNYGPYEIHYTIRLSATGQEPATQQGAMGNIEGREAEILVAYYEALSNNEVRAVLIDQLTQEVIWTRQDAWLSSPVPSMSYEDWIQSLGLKIIREEDPVLSILAVVPKNLYGPCKNALNGISGYGGDPLPQKLSPTGDPPHTHYCGVIRVPVAKMAAIEAAFPVNPTAEEDICVLWGVNLYWTNKTGMTEGGISNIHVVVKDENLKTMGRKVPDPVYI